VSSFLSFSMDQFPVLLNAFLSTFSSRATTLASSDVLVKISVVAIAILDLHHSTNILENTMDLIFGILSACIKRINTPGDICIDKMYSVIWILLSGVTSILVNYDGDIQQIFSKNSSVWTQLAPILSKLNANKSDVVIGLDWELAGFNPMKRGSVVSPYTRFSRCSMEKVEAYFTTIDGDIAPTSIKEMEGRTEKGEFELEDVLAQRTREAGESFAEAFSWCLEYEEGVFVYVGAETDGKDDVESESSGSSCDSPAAKSPVAKRFAAGDYDIDDLDPEMRELIVCVELLTNVDEETRSWK
jgi:hypothetical protein